MRRGRRRRVARLLSSLAAKGYTVDAKTAATARAYATDVLGSVRHADWLIAYAAIRGRFEEGWIPVWYFKDVVLPHVNAPFSALAKHKPLTRRLFVTDSIPDIGYVINGGLYSRDLRPISPDEFRELALGESDRFVFKRSASLRGHGIKVLDRATLDANALRSGGEGVLQRFVRQHPFFQELTPDSVATIRLLSVREPNGKTAVRGASIRLARATEDHVKTDTAVKLAIGLDDGVIRAPIYLPDWTKIDRHPDSGIDCVGRQIPALGDAVQLVNELHDRFPLCGVVGWDIAIDSESKPIVLEWNAVIPSVDYAEPVLGPCFRGLGWEQLWRTKPTAG